MKANELRLGNWVLAEGNPYQIKHISPDDEWEPIELSSEILEKAGFKRTGELTFDHKDGNYVRESSDQYWYYVKTTGNLRSIKYLHELQNLYFALTGNELEINLT